MTFEEIAQEMGLSAANVRVICTKALRKLKRKLAIRGYKTEDFFGS